MTQKTKVTIGLVGVANHGRTIYNAIRAAENLTLTSCFDTNRAAAARKHVFVEKPIAVTIPEGREMIDRMGQAGLGLMVGHNTRRRQVFRRAKAILDEGMIGSIVGIECYPTSLKLELTENGEPSAAFDEEFRQEGAGSYNLQMREFGECVLAGREPETGGKEGLRALAAIEAMRQSLMTATFVDVEKLLAGVIS